MGHKVVKVVKVVVGSGVVGCVVEYMAHNGGVYDSTIVRHGVVGGAKELVAEIYTDRRQWAQMVDQIMRT